jgi:putative FmdB family regulatory protein
MPTYDYLCENGHRFDLVQRFSDDALDTCVECGAPCKRLLHAPAIHFKGSGFYSTDYGSKKRGPNGAGQESKSESSSSSSGGGESGGSSGGDSSSSSSSSESSKTPASSDSKPASSSSSSSSSASD